MPKRNLLIISNFENLVYVYQFKNEKIHLLS
jgi:hypothetical protein